MRGSRGDGFAGGCPSLIALLVEIPVAALLVTPLVLRGWGRTDERAGPPSMDRVPVRWPAAFALTLLVVAGAFLYWGHPYAGAVQLLVAATALVFAVTVRHGEYEHARGTGAPTGTRDQGCHDGPRRRPLIPPGMFCSCPTIAPARRGTAQC